jgi:hypothetical protein
MHTDITDVLNPDKKKREEKKKRVRGVSRKLPQVKGRRASSDPER